MTYVSRMIESCEAAYLHCEVEIFGSEGLVSLRLEGVRHGGVLVNGDDVQAGCDEEVNTGSTSDEIDKLKNSDYDFEACCVYSNREE